MSTEAHNHRQSLGELLNWSVLEWFLKRRFELTAVEVCTNISAWARR